MANKDIKLRTPLQKEHIATKLNRKLRDLSKHHKGNKYEIKDNKILLISGRHPHKVSKKVK